MTGLPARFHVIWLEPGSLPKDVARNRDSWRRAHPGWETVLWRESDLGGEAFRPEALDRLRSPLERSQLVRFELLLRHGGAVVDPLMECVSPIDSLLDGSSLTVLERIDGSIDDGLLAAAPANPLVAEAFRLARPREFWGHDLSGTNWVLLASVLDGAEGVTRIPLAQIAARDAKSRSGIAIVDHRPAPAPDERENALLAERALASAQEELDQERDALDGARSALAELEAQLAGRRHDVGLAGRLRRAIRRPIKGHGD